MMASRGSLRARVTLVRRTDNERTHDKPRPRTSLTMQDIPPEQSLIEYPCYFPIKVMGAHVEGLVAAIAHVARQFDPSFDPETIEQRPSKGGNYLGLTISVYVTNRETLDELYRTLSSHPMVKVVL